LHPKLLPGENGAFLAFFLYNYIKEAVLALEELERLFAAAAE